MKTWDLAITGMGLTGNKTTEVYAGPACHECGFGHGHNLNCKYNTKFLTTKVIDNGKEGFVHMEMNDDVLIYQIAEIRSKNNLNWMALLRLAFKYAPEEARGLMKNISECDSQINELTKQLAEEK